MPKQNSGRLPRSDISAVYSLILLPIYTFTMPDADAAAKKGEDFTTEDGPDRRGENYDDDSIDSDDDLVGQLRSTSNYRKEERRRRSKRRGLRTKFEIESLYIELYELRRQNNELRQILRNLKVDAPPKGIPPEIVQQKAVPSLVVVSDIDSSRSDRAVIREEGVCRKKGDKSKYDTTEDDELKRDFQRLFYS